MENTPSCHSWGSQVKGCSCGCRSSGFHEKRLAEKGLYGLLVLIGGEVRNGTQVYQGCRQTHACEIALANGPVPSHVGNMKGKSRFEIAGVGRLHESFGPLSMFREPMDIMQSIAMDLLKARDVLLGNPKLTPATRIFEQAIQEWGQSPLPPAQVMQFAVPAE